MSPFELAVQLVRGMNPEERAKFFDAIGDILPGNSAQQDHICPSNTKGHKLKWLGNSFRWFRPPADKFVCTQCGKVLYK